MRRSVRLMVVGMTVAGALAGAAVPAAAGRAWSTVGDTAAELHWDGKRAAPSAVTLTVTRGETATAFRNLAGRRWGIAPGMPLAVRDLDGDGAREAIAELTTGGVRCCQRTVIARWAADEGRDRLTVHDWGATGYRLRDLNRDGRPEFISADVRLAGLPGVPARAERLPIRIWSFRAGVMRDVTRSHRAAVRADMVAHRDEADALMRRGLNPRGAIAAYLADARILGGGRGPWNRMRARDTAPGAERFYAALARRFERLAADAATTEGTTR